MGLTGYCCGKPERAKAKQKRSRVPQRDKKVRERLYSQDTSRPHRALGHRYSQLSQLGRVPRQEDLWNDGPVVVRPGPASQKEGSTRTTLNQLTFRKYAEYT